MWAGDPGPLPILLQKMGNMGLAERQEEMRRRIVAGKKPRKRPTRRTNPYLLSENFVDDSREFKTESVANGRQADSKSADEGSTPSTLAIPLSLAGVCAPPEPPVAVEVAPRRPKAVKGTQGELKSILDSKPDTLDPGRYSQLSKQVAAMSLIHTRAWTAQEIAQLFGWPVAMVQAWITLSKRLL